MQDYVGSTTTEYYCGLDLGKQNDYTALCVVRPVGDTFHIQGIERYRGVPYPDVVRRTRARLVTPPLYRKNSLVIDATAVGIPVVDMFREYGLGFKAVTIHGGEHESVSQGYYRVPKSKLVYNLLVEFQRGRVRLPDPHPVADLLANELANFKRKQNTSTGHEQFSHREGEHDDLVLATALAVWDAVKGRAGPVSSSSSGPFKVEGGLPFDYREAGRVSLPF